MERVDAEEYNPIEDTIARLPRSRVGIVWKFRFASVRYRHFEIGWVISVENSGLSRPILNGVMDWKFGIAVVRATACVSRSHLTPFRDGDRSRFAFDFCAFFANVKYRPFEFWVVSLSIFLELGMLEFGTAARAGLSVFCAGSGAYCWVSVAFAPRRRKRVS